MVLLPYRFTLFSNEREHSATDEMFYYLIDLHYSQTIDVETTPTTGFTTL